MLEDPFPFFLVNKCFLFDIIKGDVGIFLKDSDLSHDLLGYAASGQITDATVFKCNANGGNIIEWSQHVYADSLNVFTNFEVADEVLELLEA